MRSKSRPLEKSVSEYGDNSLHLSEKHAKSKAWISPFVMHPYHLIDISQYIDPLLYKKLVKKYGSGSVDYEIIRGEPALEKIRNKLYQFDFTLEDFESIVKGQLVKRLRAMKEETPSLYKETHETLTNGAWASIAEILEREVFGPLNIPSHWELKVPVAIPPEEVDKIKTITKSISD